MKDYFESSSTLNQESFGTPSSVSPGNVTQPAFVPQVVQRPEQSYGWTNDTLDAKRALRNLGGTSGAYWGTYGTGTSSVANNTQTTPAWGAGASSESSSLTANSFTVPSAGTYSISGTLRWNGTAGGTRQALLLKNGSFVTAGVQPSNGGANDEYCNLSVVQVLAAGDVIRLDAFQNSGTTVSLIANNCKFSIFKIA